MSSPSEKEPKVAVVTGANSGIGKVTVSSLLKQGYRVIATARSKERGEAALADWKKEVPDGNVTLVLCNLSDLKSVREAARQIAEQVTRIDVLLNNAGGIIGQRHVTPEGLEETLGGNHLGHFVLTQALLPLLEKAAPARIVNVSSSAHSSVKDMRWDDLSFEGGYSAPKAYGQSKLANILFTRALAKRLDATKVTANALHPGVVRTRFGETGGGVIRFAVSLIRPFLIDDAQGADTQLWLATDPSLEGKTGGYYAKRKPAKMSKAASSDEGAERLWALSEKLARKAEAAAS